MMTVYLVAHPNAPELDKSWFADRRRAYRFRPPLPGERGGAVLVRRDGARMHLDGARDPARFEVGADETLLTTMGWALESVGFPMEPSRKMAEPGGPAREFDRRATADAKGSQASDETGVTHEA